jgi:hypothetical protein
LVIVAAQLSPDFIGTPAEFYQAMVERMSIQSPSGTQFFVVGDSEPSGNQGPWLRNGTQWWVFDVATGRYVPLDISESVEALFVISPTNPGTPGAGDPVLWGRTVGSRGVSWYGWTGTEWRPIAGVSPSGPTSARPTDAVDYELYFDTDINVQLHWERGAWRTVSGSPGDIKAVIHATAALALSHNPGWALYGESDASVLGRVIGVASKDPGGSPVESLPVGAGITPRASGDQAGAETHTLASGETEQHTHIMGHATALNSDNNIQLHRVDDGDDVSIPAPVPPNYFQVNGDGSGNGTNTGTAGNGPTGTVLITTKQLSLADEPAFTEAADPHNNIQPTVFLWHLVKQ